MKVDDWKDRVNMDRMDNIKKLHPKIVRNATNNLNDKLDTKDITNHINKDIKVVINLLNSYHNEGMYKSHYDLLYLSLLHLVDAMSLVEELKVKKDIDDVQDLLNFMMRGFKDE